MYGYNPLAIDQLARAHVTQIRRDGSSARRARRHRKARRQTRLDAA
jgi:hypothetical protein